MLALWPGLDAVHRRLARHFRAEPDLLVSEVTGRITDSIHRLDLSRVNWIAATLIRNTERDIRRQLRADWAEAARSEALPEGPAEPAGTSSVLGLPDGVDPDAAIDLLTERVRAWIGHDAALVIAVAVGGDRQREAAEQLGIAPETARKRYQRAVRRLRVVFEDFS